MIPLRYISLDVYFAQDPGCARTCLRCRQLFQPNQSEDSGWRDPESGGNLTYGHFAAGLPFSVTVDWNRMVVAQ